MGKVRTKTVKKASKIIVEKYYNSLTTDFDTNKKVCQEIAIIPTKRMRNKIAGFTTHLMARIKKGTVRGISLKLQEEERERRMDYVPEVSYVEEIINKGIEVSEDVSDMLKTIGFGDLKQVTRVSHGSSAPHYQKRRGNKSY
ncbi:hypothetical protein C9374_012630 [Naegleria lovaniensis]|uniref:40S ribosomal protein S17 n=1 Tax=Naegleria lovaniensis TaxID=51637 RepID=A0AA88KNQ3_NAELO|nr:uncharacterized protein C9374_012630 [Naegleria lovaniensis]KAG2392378.1 hypothetical protein C9374_012630 [Naegleria lovaniensis]